MKIKHRFTAIGVLVLALFLTSCTQKDTPDAPIIPENYTITFDKNDPLAVGTMEPQTIAGGASSNLNSNSFTNPGWAFAGWAESSNGPVVYSNNANYNMGSANVTLYAKWGTPYIVGGTISGLSGTVVLQNNGVDSLQLNSSGAFSFVNSIIEGGSYNVSVKTHPMSQVCTVTNGTGIVTNNITSIAVSCIADTNTFVTRWKTDNPGNTNSNQIKLPLSSSGTYNFFIYWGDGTSNTITTSYQSEITHTYATPGTYDVIMKGTIVGFGFSGSSGDNAKLIDILQWGAVKLHNNGYQFASTSLSTLTAIDTPALSDITNMSGMFAHASTFNQNISNWDMSSVTNMSYMFSYASAFNQNISNWDVSSVTNMNYMFLYASTFNQDISSWDVNKVTNMSGMFAYSSSFNQNISSWNVSNVTDMSVMFANATSFNQNISSWNVSHVTNMSYMFSSASSFNQNINNWNVSNVTDMECMFYEATVFNQPIGNWDVGKVTSMVNMFRDATVFNQNISGWNVSSVKNMALMFYGARDFNQPIENWDVSNVTNMFAMFEYASSFNQPIGNWNVSNVTAMHYMFYAARAFNQPIGNWNVSKVTNMSFMFCDANAFNQDINSWNVSSVTDMHYMFTDAYNFNQPIGNWNVSNVTNMGYMFSSATIFNQNISSWNVSNVTNYSEIFTSCPILESYKPTFP